MYNWSFLFVVLHKPTLLPSTFKKEIYPLSLVLVTIGFTHKKHPLSQVFSGKLPETKGQKMPPSWENGNTHVASLYIWVGGGGLHTRPSWHQNAYLHLCGNTAEVHTVGLELGFRWGFLLQLKEKQRCHRYYPKFPELYSRRINSLIITALKYLTEH